LLPAMYYHSILVLQLIMLKN